MSKEEVSRYAIGVLTEKTEQQWQEDVITRAIQHFRKRGWPIMWNRCRRCGSATITDGEREWCSFVGGRDMPGCSWSDELSLNFKAICRLLKEKVDA